MACKDSSRISRPGPGWHMVWPAGGITNIQLDVVGFLAILGEDAVKKTSRLASLSSLFLLPRLLPAPHSLLYSERPEELDVLRAKVVGVYNGNVTDHLSHVGGAIFGPMPPYTVRCCLIKRRESPRRAFSWSSERQSSKDGSASDHSTLRAKPTGPHVLANVFGCALSVVLLVLSITFGDGMSLLATLLLSATSVLVGITNRWRLTLPMRLSSNVVIPPADTVIKWPNGSFLIVRCGEDLARHLFFSPETIDYTLSQPNGFITLSLFGTLFLMISVVALANAKIQLQIAWAVSYVILNIAHWLAAALPRRLNWDFSAFVLAEQGIEGGPHSSNYTEALWKAIVLTQDIGWVKRADAVPLNENWHEWLAEAEGMSKESIQIHRELEDPMWKGEFGGQPVVWTVPGWDPKGAYVRIAGF